MVHLSTRVDLAANHLFGDSPVRIQPLTGLLVLELHITAAIKFLTGVGPR